MAALLVAVPRADAVELTWKGQPHPQPYQGWADSAKVPTYPGKVRLSTSWRRCRSGPHVWGCALWKPLTVVLHKGGKNRRTLHHELGHIFDFVVMGHGRIVRNRLVNPRSLGRMTASRRLYARYIGRRGSWAGGDDPIRERFADSYAACARNPTEIIGQIPWGYDAGGERHRAICALIEREYAARFQ